MPNVRSAMQSSAILEGVKNSVSMENNLFQKELDM